MVSKDTYAGLKIAANAAFERGNSNLCAVLHLYSLLLTLSILQGTLPKLYARLNWLLTIVHMKAWM